MTVTLKTIADAAARDGADADSTREAIKAMADHTWEAWDEGEGPPKAWRAALLLQWFGHHSQASGIEAVAAVLHLYAQRVSACFETGDEEAAGWAVQWLAINWADALNGTPPHSSVGPKWKPPGPDTWDAGPVPRLPEGWYMKDGLPEAEPDDEQFDIERIVVTPDGEVEYWQALGWLGWP